ncbi:MAG TPA: DUF86 domain-containing protein [Oscillatoriales cyanobacterium M59_W2019_021]|nr:MAG: DUF86 domain-containing protein [Cyanobacteria bacterium J055]HIK30564.1 DUF86 domain-containing protein [Oscillatoriales cyanobacterium M4454_W2019_049]HIK50509.1 DUF86 domain-containing protein [Oscillatoriales cyanobacterium M59_W2019_021]
MTPRGLRESLEDIVDAISEINSFVRGITFEDFLSNREKVLAVVKLLEIIGEATKKIPGELRNKYPEIPWSSVAGMRDILVHEYWQVDVEVVWQTIEESLPELARVISEMIREN